MDPYMSAVPERTLLNFGSDRKIFWKKRMPEGLFKTLEKGEERWAEICAGQHSAIPWWPTVKAKSEPYLQHLSPWRQPLSSAPVQGPHSSAWGGGGGGGRDISKQDYSLRNRKIEKGSSNRKKVYRTVKWDWKHDCKRWTLCASVFQCNQKDPERVEAADTHTHTHTIPMWYHVIFRD